MAGLTGCAPKLAPKAPPPLVTVAQPITRRIIDWDDYVGQFVAPESVEVRPRVAGYIQSIAFKDGAEVRKGDLFVIDPRPYKAVLDQAKAQQQHAQAAVQGAEIEERRAEGLVEAKALSHQDLQTRKSTLAQARADLESRQEAEDAVRVTVAAETTRAYLQARSNAEQGDVARRSADRRFALSAALYVS
jgi:multidrug efflux pump subunit AcrA (membrane-fusion protein)